MMSHNAIIFSRIWAMPSADTFSIPPIGTFVKRYLQGVSIDPFARNNKATYTNDLNPNTMAYKHMPAQDFLQLLVSERVKADTLIFDPPYSPRQISECYAEAGIKTRMYDTQNSKLMRECRELFRQLANPEAICLSFGWNSVGMGKGWKILEIMIVCHGGAHNDTICMAEQKTQETLF